MNFYNFIYKNISIYFHLKKVIYTNYLNKKNITLFAKEILIKRKKIKSSISKKYF